MVRFVTIKKFCELTGYSVKAVYARRSQGNWMHGVVWLYEPGTRKILMDLVGFERWVETGDRAAHVGASLGSPTRPILDGNGSSSARRGLSPLPPVLEPPEPRKRAPLRPVFDPPDPRTRRRAQKT